MLVNAARGPVIDEAALVAHMQKHPNFRAGEEGGAGGGVVVEGKKPKRAASRQLYWFELSCTHTHTHVHAGDIVDGCLTNTQTLDITYYLHHLLLSPIY